MVWDFALSICPDTWTLVELGIPTKKENGLNIYWESSKTKQSMKAWKSITIQFPWHPKTSHIDVTTNWTHSAVRCQASVVLLRGIYDQYRGICVSSSLLVLTSFGGILQTGIWKSIWKTLLYGRELKECYQLEADFITVMNPIH